MTTTDATDAVTLAAAHGLHLDPATVAVNDAGLDYRVVMADDRAGRRWVLRLPRRPDVSAGMSAEVRILDLVRPVLADDGVAVPDWQVRAPGIVAYPALPGAPGLTLSDAGEPVWHMDPASPDYALRLGRLLARLHSVRVEQAAVAEVEVRTAARVRQVWRDDVARVCDEFTVAPALVDAWQAWLDDDVCWPDHTVMTHGEIYPAHVLLDDDGVITGVLDWTTARVDDPARDFSAQYGAGGEEMLRVSLAAYEEAGGRVHAGLAAQARHLWEAFPVVYALFALTTRAEKDMEAAAAMLDPDQTD
ncbi:macrolide 2'-phosphotransferase [Cellulomonas wangsupingiae]|uniref:Macrolide 2'-phosphotransferase n=1 Tax=Cellulomonas wangsupingiae TaxID=2968085 RepID=A0ABY5K273_9CELL|nr:macrolide 2'-phosphotransferase [Cellulomonas wangsupingiae]MCC2335409.1 macrolide 2'-phosphotransferase [Cellulomonas wangsupingiae]MCM0640059.1 macrolide 2'-phosphotransferase [Cellulomonas wangsupingiae]UUI64415.1 macrolide 2'-phosphotransferase [Cellulomonas wangsupingiae]